MKTRENWWKNNFINRLVLVYTLIAFVPFAAMIIAASEYIKVQQNTRILADAEQRLAEDAGYITQCINTVYRLESAIVSSNDFSWFFTFGDRNDIFSVMTYIRSISDELNRFKISQPLVYAIRIFTKDETIPEFWPVFYHSRRLQNQVTQKWQYNYGTELLMVSDIDREIAVVYSDKLEFHHREAGILQILIRMTDFFPFIYQSRIPNAVLFSGEVIAASPNFPALSGKTCDAITGVTDISSGTLTVTEDIKRTFSFYRIPATELILIQDCTKELNSRNIIFFRLVALLSIILACLVVFLSVRFVTKKMTMRLYAFLDNLKKFKSGNLNFVFDVEGSDEISDLIKTSGTMISEIIKQRIREAVENVRTIDNKFPLDISASHPFYFALLISDTPDIAFNNIFNSQNRQYILDTWNRGFVCLIDEKDKQTLENISKSGMKLIIVIGQKCTNRLSLSSGWREIQIARFNQFFLLPGKILYCRSDTHAFDQNRPYMKIQEIITTLGNCETEKLKDNVNNLFNLADVPDDNRPEHLYFLHRCFIQQLAVYFGTIIEEDIYLGAKKIILETPWNFVSLDEWKKHITDFIIYLNFLLKNQQKHHSFVDTALRWIHEHFSEDISMTIVANQVSVNYTYFSEKFKEQTGYNFNDYISRLRINMAKIMLETGYYTISEVALKCGYKDEKYFGKVFKTMIGMSPGEYRRKNYD